VNVPKNVLSNGVLESDSEHYFDFMGPSPCADPSDSSTCLSPFAFWLSSFEWETLFGFLRSNSLDPEVLMVPILLGPSGAADILPTSMQSLTDITQDDEGGQYSV